MSVGVAMLPSPAAQPLARLNGAESRHRVLPDVRLCVACGAAIAALGPRPDRRRYCDACLAKPRCRECSRRGGLHWPSCRWEQRRHYVPAPRRDAVTVEELVHLLTAYRLDLLRRAAAVVGFHDAEDVAQATAEDLTRRLPTLEYLTVNYLRRAVRSTALLTIRRRQCQRRAPEVSMGTSQSLVGLAGDVYRSDVLQDSGTPLQWLLAWETVGDRERAERARAERAAARAMPLRVSISEIVAASRPTNGTHRAAMSRTRE
jgi:hypothetical protein